MSVVVKGNSLDDVAGNVVQKALSGESPKDGIWRLSWKQGNKIGDVNISDEVLSDMIASGNAKEKLVRQVSLFSDL